MVGALGWVEVEGRGHCCGFVCGGGYVTDLASCALRRQPPRPLAALHRIASSLVASRGAAPRCIPSVRGGVADGVKACQRRHRLGGPCPADRLVVNPGHRREGGNGVK